MNAMILAAGVGSRLGELGRTLPKVLVDVGGRPLLARHLDYLGQHGIRRVVINVHHLADQIESFLRSYTGPIDIVPVFEPRLLGTAGGVRNALRFLEPGPFFLLYGDVLVRQPLFDMFALHRDAHAVATLAVHDAESAEGKGTVEATETGRVTRFVEKGVTRAAQSLINSGIYVLESEFVASLSAGPSDFGQDVFPKALAERLPLYAFRLSEPVIDVGTPEGLALAQSTLDMRSPAEHAGALST